MMEEKPFDIHERTFNFAVEVVTLTRKVPKDTVGRTITQQLVRSGTSIGANVEEADAGESRADFVHKISIALKEARETHYWLRLLVATSPDQQNNLAPLVSECNQLMRILAAIIRKSRSNP